MPINGKLSAPPAPQLAQARARGGFRSGAAPAPIPTLFDSNLHVTSTSLTIQPPACISYAFTPRCCPEGHHSSRRKWTPLRTKPPHPRWTRSRSVEQSGLLSRSSILVRRDKVRCMALFLDAYTDYIRMVSQRRGKHWILRSRGTPP